MITCEKQRKTLNTDYESVGQRFESSRARHQEIKALRRNSSWGLFLFQPYFQPLTLLFQFCQAARWLIICVRSLEVRICIFPILISSFETPVPDWAGSFFLAMDLGGGGYNMEPTRNQRLRQRSQKARGCPSQGEAIKSYLCIELHDVYRNEY